MNHAARNVLVADWHTTSRDTYVRFLRVLAVRGVVKAVRCWLDARRQSNVCVYSTTCVGVNQVARLEKVLCS